MVLTSSHPKDSKVEALCESLRQLAREKGPDAQLPTVRVLCDLFGTTRVTLTEALNSLEEQHVLYRIDRKGIYVSPKIYHKFIHILFDTSTMTTSDISPFWSMLWVCFMREAQRRAETKAETCTFQLVMPTLHDGETIPDEVIHTLRSGQYDGLLTVGFNIGSEEWQERQPIPSVAFAGYGKYAVRLNTEELVHRGVNALARQGMKKLGLWFSPPLNLDMDLVPEYQYFRQSLARAKLPFYPELVRRPTPPPQQDKNLMVLNYQEYGYQMAMETFGQHSPEKPDGLLILDDMLTAGGLTALQELGIHAGSEVKIVTHANKGSPLLFGHTKDLTLLEFDPAIIVKCMFSMLDMLLAGEKPFTPIISLSPELRGEFLARRSDSPLA